MNSFVKLYDIAFSAVSQSFTEKILSYTEREMIFTCKPAMTASYMSFVSKFTLVVQCIILDLMHYLYLMNISNENE